MRWRNGRLRELLHRALLVGTSIVVAIVAAEVVVRLALERPPRGNITPVPRRIIVRSQIPGLPYVLRSDAEVRHRFPSNPTGYFDADGTLTYRTNALGFRGRETTLEKPDGIFRILGMGDSFTFGTGVRREDTFLAVLERQLDQAVGPGRVEVLNLGVMGYNTVQEEALLRQVGARYQPDLVVICFFLNDTGEGATHSLFNVANDDPGVGSWIRLSVLLDRLLWSIDRRRQTSELIASYQAGFRHDSPGWIAARHALDAARQLAEQERFDLVLMVLPVLWRLSDEYPFQIIHERVVSHARERGIAVLDLLPSFAGHDGPELWVHATNQHPNATAHAIAGEALYRFLADEGLIDLRERRPTSP